MKFENVVSESSLFDKLGIEDCGMKVKVTVGLQIYHCTLVLASKLILILNDYLKIMYILSYSNAFANP